VRLGAGRPLNAYAGIVPRRTAVKVASAILSALGLASIAGGLFADQIWPEPDQVTALSASGVHESNAIITDPGVLNLVNEDVTIRATVPDGQPVTLAIGRDVDVDGWVGTGQAARVVGLADWQTLTTDDAVVAGSTTVPDPAGSDMWVAEASGIGSAEMHWQDVPGRWSLLAVNGGADPTTPQIELTWPREFANRWRWPLIGAGIGLTALGAALALFGPRKPDPVPDLEPVPSEPVASSWSEIIGAEPIPTPVAEPVRFEAPQPVTALAPAAVEVELATEVIEPAGEELPSFDALVTGTVTEPQVVAEPAAVVEPAVLAEPEVTEWPEPLAPQGEPVAAEPIVTAAVVEESEPTEVIVEPVVVAEPTEIVAEPAVTEIIEPVRVATEFIEPPHVTTEFIEPPQQVWQAPPTEPVAEVDVAVEAPVVAAGADGDYIIGQARVFASPATIEAPAPTSRREVKLIRRATELTGTIPIVSAVPVTSWPAHWDEESEEVDR